MGKKHINILSDCHDIKGESEVTSSRARERDRQTGKQRKRQTKMEWKRQT